MCLYRVDHIPSTQRLGGEYMPAEGRETIPFLIYYVYISIYLYICLIFVGFSSRLIETKEDSNQFVVTRDNLDLIMASLVDAILGR